MRSLIETIVEVISQTKLFEMAHSLQKSKDTVDSLSLHITEHLVKAILLGPQHRDFKHWCGEINGALKKYRFKTFNNKYPRVDQYMDWFFDYGQDVDLELFRSGWIQDMFEDEYHTAVDFDPTHLYNQVKQIMMKVFEDLSKGIFPNATKYLLQIS